MIDKEYLANNPTHIFVFGDNKLRRGYGGAAKLRDVKNTYGFITKRAPDNKDSSFYKVADYIPTFEREVKKLIDRIEAEPGNVFLISRLGGGLANKYKIFENVIEPEIEKLAQKYDNVKLV